MTHLLRWKSGTLALMTMAITTSAITPMIAFAPANAQYSQYGGNVTIPSGVTFPVRADSDKIVIKPGETKSVTLRVANDIIDRNRNVLIPAGTKIEGQLVPVTLDSYSRDTNSAQGVRFVAQQLVFANGRRQSIDATSRTYTRIERITQGPSTGQVLTDAAIGGGAGLLGSLITGNRRVDDVKPVIGAGAGAAASILLRKKQVDAFVIRPDQDLRITLNSNLVVYRY